MKLLFFVFLHVYFTFYYYWFRLAPNGTNLGLFKISFSTFWLAERKCTETDLKKSQICFIWGQSDPIRMPNYTSLHMNSHRDDAGETAEGSLVDLVDLVAMEI